MIAMYTICVTGEMPRALHLQSLRAGDCSDADKCLGVNGDGRCVCNVFE